MHERSVAEVDAPGRAVPSEAPLACRMLSPGPLVMPGPHDLFARATLDTWLDRALTATTLSEVWGDPAR